MDFDNAAILQQRDMRRMSTGCIHNKGGLHPLTMKLIALSGGGIALL